MKWYITDLKKWIKNGCDKTVGDSVILLNIENNNLTTLPPEIGNLINLQKFYCSYNKLIALPAEIGNLINLKKLDLSNNVLCSLPAEIGRLRNLKKLYLGNNSLTSLPAEIGRLCNLQKFHIDEYSYEINNLDPDCPILILGKIKNPITNLPSGLKTIYLSKDIDISMIKIPFRCEINYDFDKILK